jgi:hypothetical protein
VPWSLPDARAAFVTATSGVLLLVLAYWWASGTGDADDQVSATVLGVVAVVLVGTAGLIWVLSGRRAVRLRRVELIDRIAELGDDRAATLDADDAPLVGLPGSARFHRPDCLLVRGKDVQLVARDGGGRDCEMCRP